jgi:PAS domain S-box-containing protein
MNSDISPTKVAMAHDAIESMRDAVMSLDRTGRVIMLNPAAEQLLGVQAADVVGTLFAELHFDREEWDPFNDCVLQAVYAPATPHVSEITLTLADGEKRNLVIRTNLLKSAEGQAEGVVVVAADISEKVRLLEERVEQKRIQHQFGQFFLYLLSINVIGTFINYLLATYLESLDVYGEAFKWGYLFILLIPTLIAIRVMKIPIQDLGVTLKNWRKSLIEGIVVSGILLAAGIVLVAVLRHYSWTPSNPAPFAWGGILPYFIHAYIQELLGRGVMQSSFERFFDDRTGFKSVVLASIFAGMLHIHFGLMAVLIIFVVSLFAGAFYLRHHNLIGVTLVHGVLGVFAFVSGIL